MTGLPAEQPASVRRKRKFWLKLGLLIGLPVSLGLVVWRQLSWRPREFRFGQVLTCVAFVPHGGKIALVSVPDASDVTVLAPINADVTPNLSSRVSFFAPEQSIVRPLKQATLWAKPVTALRYSAEGTLLATATERWFTEDWLSPIGFGSSTIKCGMRGRAPSFARSNIPAPWTPLTAIPTVTCWRVATHYPHLIVEMPNLALSFGKPQPESR